MKEVQIIDTGIANIASVKAAFDRLGCNTAITNNADVIRQSEYVVLPGVGSFGAGMRALNRFGLGQVIVDRITSNAPLLGICLGMQLLCSSSEETRGVNGLGIIDAEITRFPNSVRTPQHGWNRVSDGYAYFSNTYRLSTIPDGWDGELSFHGESFVAMLRRGTTLACQFHPELSGDWGKNILSEWLQCREGVSTC